MGVARHGLDRAEDITAKEGGKEAVVRTTCYHVYDLCYLTVLPGSSLS